MPQRFVNVDRQTPMMLPPDLRDWVAENDLVQIILEATELCDLRVARVNERGTGSAQYPPSMMLALLIYCYATGVLSSRRIERATYDSVAVRFLCANHHPDHDTIAHFRRQNERLFVECFGRVLLLARQAGVLKVGTIALDGTKLAGAGSSRAVKDLGALEAELRQLGAALRQRAEETDQLDLDGEGTQLPPELASAEKRREKLQAALAQIEARRQEAAQTGQANRPGTSRQTGQASVSEPESRRLRGNGGGFVQGYNVQVAADAGTSGLILGMHLSDASNDSRQLLPSLAALSPAAGAVQVVLVDKGYDNAVLIAEAEDTYGVTVLCPPQARPHARPERRHRWDAQRERVYVLRERMRTRMADPANAALFARRKATIEPVFARLKRHLGFTRFQCWGHAGASAELTLVSLAHNLRKLAGKIVR